MIKVCGGKAQFVDYIVIIFSIIPGKVRSSVEGFFGILVRRG